jgi:pimeloyl-ACP methyl ester carboxylesterase
MPAMSAGRSYTLRYFDRPGSGPTILYIHGLGCSKADVMEMTSFPELQSFRLVSADNPGCGDSPYDENHPLNIDGIVELIENFVTHLRLNRFLLVGGSMGGAVALLYAERNPDKIAGFVNVEGNLAPEDCMFSRKVIPHAYSHFEKIVFPQMKKALSAKAGPGVAQHLRVLEKANPRAYYDYAFQTVEYSDHGNLLERFLSLQIPKCFLYGSENRHLSYLQRLLESECVVIEIPNAGHFLFYDQPNHYAAALSSFARNSCVFSRKRNIAMTQQFAPSGAFREHAASDPSQLQTSPFFPSLHNAPGKTQKTNGSRKSSGLASRLYGIGVGVNSTPRKPR